VDNFYRVSAFVDEVRRGKSTAEAAQTARDIAFDYTALTDFEKGVLRKFILFYSFQRRNLDLFYDTLLTNPGRITAQLRTLNYANETVLGDDNDLITPTYLEGRLLLMSREALKDSYSSGRIVTMAPPIPVNDVLNLWGDMLAVGTEDGRRELFARTTPWAQAVPVMATGIDPFSGREFGKYDKIPMFLYESDMAMTGGLFVRGVLGGTWQDNKDPSSNDSDESRGYIQARNARLWWFYRNFLQFPGAGRSMGTLEMMDRMNRGPGQWVVDVTRNYREAGGLAEADAFFVGLQPVVETVVGESLATPPLRDPNMALQVLAQEDLVDARVGLTPLNELTSLMGVRAVRVDNPAVAKDRLFREAGFELREDIKELRRAEQYPSRK
jgi:hypothetical protein